MKTKWQLHHQPVDQTIKETIFIAERDLEDQNDIRDFLEETISLHELPEDCMWLFVNEDSDLFVKEGRCLNLNQKG